MTSHPFDRFEGVPFLPVTPFDERDRVDVTLLEQHVADRVEQGAPRIAATPVEPGLRLGSLPVGPVRPPLVDPTAEQIERLRRLLDVGHEPAA